MRRCSANACAYASAPNLRSSLVEPSTSVNRKCPVPTGRPRDTTKSFCSLRSADGRSIVEIAADVDTPRADDVVGPGHGRFASLAVPDTAVRRGREASSPQVSDQYL